MLRYIDLFVYVIYNYYKNGRKYQDQAFFNTKIALIVIFFFNLESIAVLSNHDFATKLLGDLTTPMAYVKALVFFVIPAYAIISILFKESRVKELEISASTKKKATNFVLAYFGFTILLLIVAVNLKS